MGKCFSPSVGSSFSGTYCPEVAVSHECINAVTKNTSHCSQDTTTTNITTITTSTTIATTTTTTTTKAETTN